MSPNSIEEVLNILVLVFTIVKMQRVACVVCFAVVYGAQFFAYGVVFHTVSCFKTVLQGRIHCASNYFCHTSQFDVINNCFTRER